MAQSSKYFRLHNQILVEYVYTDNLDPLTYSTSSYGLQVLTNNYNGLNYVFSPVSTPTDMGNIISRSAVQLGTGSSEYVYLNTNLPISYNNYDNNLTSTDDLNLTFAPNLDVVYDTVKVHLMSGFDYDGYDGFIIEIYATQSDAKKVMLTSLVYKKGDTYEELNPNPFMMTDYMYSSYIDIKIPSLYYVMQGSKTDTNSLHAKFTRPNPLDIGATGYGKGFLNSTVINIRLLGIYETRKQNAFSYFKAKELALTSLNKTDEFSYLVARIQESSSGDYYEMYGEYNGVIYDDFMNTLNGLENNDYVVFHEYIVKEQIGTEFIETSNHSEIQTGNWDKLFKFRPIIENAGTAVSYVIEYTLRLFNKVDSTQIIKKSQYISTNPKKYGALLPRINLGIVPTIAKVYNSINNITQYVTPVVSEPVTVAEPTIRTEYVNIFIKTDKIKVTSTPIKIN